VELALTEVAEELVAFAELLEMRTQVRVGCRSAARDSAVDHGNVGPAVVVEVCKDSAETGAAPCRGEQAGSCRAIGELTASRSLLPQGVPFGCQVRHINVEEAIAVNVADGDAHAGLCLSHRVHRYAAEVCSFLECPVFLVYPQVVRLVVVGDED